MEGGIVKAAFSRKLAKNGSYIGDGAKISKWPTFPHGLYGVFISGGAEIGEDCVIFQHVTIGSNTLIDSKRFGAPHIGSNCYIGAGAKIIGNVTVGDNCRIGAGTVVVNNIPNNSVVVQGENRIFHKEKVDNRFYNKDSNGKWGYFHDGKRVVVGLEFPDKINELV
ncbi:MAG: serine acetyltransferase [Lachnospiraceae bacterium]|nr:serine acetyltransferase [Lachnospiraceae bacterium]